MSARPYQTELYRRALLHNIVAYLDTGAGKTLVSVLLMQHFIAESTPISDDLVQEWRQRQAALVSSTAPPEQITDQVAQLDSEIRRRLPDQPKKVVFLVPTIPLVDQQSRVIQQYTASSSSVGNFSSSTIGDLDPDSADNNNNETSRSKRVPWDYIAWQVELSKYQVLVMTPAIFLALLRHGLCNLQTSISLLIFDECHHAIKNHPYNRIMQEHYHTMPASSSRPKIFGMTASPIVGSVSSHKEAIWKLMELRRNLDCIVVTIRDRSSLLSFVPKATEIIIEHDTQYDQLKHSDAYIYYSHCYARLVNLHNSSRDLPTLQKFQKMLSIVDSVYADLGPYSAGSIADAYLTAITNSMSRVHGETVKRKRVTFDEDGNENWAPMDIPMLREFDYLPTESTKGTAKGFDSLDTAEFAHDVLPPAPLIQTVNIGDFPPKLLSLTGIIKDSLTADKFRGLIFVSKRANAKALCDLLTDLNPILFDSRLKSGFVTGHGQSTATDKHNMSTTAQRSVIHDFRRGLLNLLVVTSVAEEGLDVPSCNLVIIFDALSTPASYVQTRGRARSSNSRYIIMHPRDASTSHIARAKLTEQLIQSTCEYMLKNGQINVHDTQSREDDDEQGEVLLADDDEFQVESSGARVTLDGGLDILRRYCSSLPRDAYISNAYHLVLLAEPSDDLLGYQYAVKLPSSSPFSSHPVHGLRKLSKKVAMQSAALLTVKLLYDSGCLNQNLLSVIKTPKGSELKDTLREDQTRVDYGFVWPKGGKGLFKRIVPRWLRTGDVPITFLECLKWAYSGHSGSITSDEMEISYYMTVIEVEGFGNGIAVLTSEKIPEIPSVTINSRSVKFIRFENPLELTPRQSEIVRDYQYKFFAMLLNKLTIPKMAKNDDVLFELPNVDESDTGSCFYRVIPVIRTNDAWVVDWEYAEIILEYSCAWNSFLLKYAELSADATAFDGQVVLVPHNLMKYTIVNSVSDVYCHDKISDDENAPSYREYFSKNFGITLQRADLPLIKVQHMLKFRNLLTERYTGPMDEERSYIHIPPELCFFSPLDMQRYEVFEYIPSTLHQFQISLTFQEFRYAFAANIPTQYLSISLTAPSADLGHNYQRLETLGDSFLKFATSVYLYRKFPNLDEGALSVHRARRVNNKRLARLGVLHQLAKYMIVTRFNPRTWAPPFIKMSDEEPDAQCVSLKMMADFVESLIGAFYIGGGVDVALDFMRRIDVVDIRMEIASTIDEFYDDRIDTMQIETRLGYKFTNKRLLYEALTHASFNEASTQSYQRLEFLGDAALDILVTKYLYQKYPDATSQQITDLRQASVNNNTFSRFALHFDLHRHLLADSPQLDRDILEYVNWYGTGQNSDIEPNLMPYDAPKIMGDLFESVVGAICADCPNLDIVWNVIGPVYRHFVDTFCDPATMARNPIRAFHELAQACGYKSHQITFESSVGELHKCDIYLDKTFVCSGTGNTAQTSKRTACIAALSTLQ